MLTYTTPDRHGYSVRFSPFSPDNILLATSQLYGLAGGGTLYLLQVCDKDLDTDFKDTEDPLKHKLISDGQSLRQQQPSKVTTTNNVESDETKKNNDTPAKRCIKKICQLEWSDGLFDVHWCSYADNVAATASGDGTLQIWGGLDKATSDDFDAFISNNRNDDAQLPVKPVLCLKGHKNEVYSIDWGEQWNYHHLISASWDSTIKLWDCNRQHAVTTFSGGHTDLIYCARYSPLIANLFASVGTDGYLNLWNSFDISGKPLMSIQAGLGSPIAGVTCNNTMDVVETEKATATNLTATSSPCEILTCDWSQYDRNVLMTGGSDGIVRAWDLRNLRHHVLELYSGEFAVRRLAFSPTSATVFATANYDFTTRIWDFKESLNALEIYEHHSEFVCGLDWNLNQSNQLADCGWDSNLNVFTPKSLKNY